MNRLKKFKDYFQIATSILLSCVNVWLSSEAITQTIGVVYKFGDMFYNPSLGIIEQDSTLSHRCKMKVASPFTDYLYNKSDIYHRIDPRYICKWSSDSTYDDSLCFEQFDCYPLKMVRDVDIACSSLFLLGFVIIFILWAFRPSNRKVRIFLWSLGTTVLISSFSVSKLSASYLRQMQEQDILDKIKDIVMNQGSLSIHYDTTVSKYDLKTTISQTIFDVCSGMALGLIANSINLLKKPRRKPVEFELRDRLLI